MGPLLLAWMTEAGIMSFRIVTRGGAADGGHLPFPADYAATFVIFGGLSLVAEAGPNAARVSTVFGWALVLATVLNLYDPKTISITRSGQITKGGKPTGQTKQPVPQPGFSGG